MKKETVIDAMTEMPQEFEPDILLEKLIFIEKVEKGLKQIRDGKTKTHEEVKEIVKKWWISFGQNWLWKIWAVFTPSYLWVLRVVRCNMG